MLRLLRLLRRVRSVAFGLLLMSPGLGGVAVQAFHPCPSHVVMQGAGMHHDAGTTHDAPAGKHAACHCIGSCAATAVQASPADGRLVAVALLPEVVLAPDNPVGAVSQHPLDRLPPSTAPPLTPAFQA